MQRSRGVCHKERGFLQECRQFPDAQPPREVHRTPGRCACDLFHSCGFPGRARHHNREIQLLDELAGQKPEVREGPFPCRPAAPRVDDHKPAGHSRIAQYHGCSLTDPRRDVERHVQGFHRKGGASKRSQEIQIVLDFMPLGGFPVRVDPAVEQERIVPVSGPYAHGDAGKKSKQCQPWGGVNDDRHVKSPRPETSQHHAEGNKPFVAIVPE